MRVYKRIRAMNKLKAAYRQACDNKKERRSIHEWLKWLMCDQLIYEGRVDRRKSRRV